MKTILKSIYSLFCRSELTLVLGIIYLLVLLVFIFGWAE